MATVLIGPTELFITSNFDGHVQAWRWYCYATGNYHYWPRFSNRIVYGSNQYKASEYSDGKH